VLFYSAADVEFIGREVFAAFGAAMKLPRGSPGRVEKPETVAIRTWTSARSS